MSVRPSATPPGGLPVNPQKTPELPKEHQSKTQRDKDQPPNVNKANPVANSILSGMVVSEEDVTVTNSRDRSKAFSIKKETDAKLVSAVSKEVLSIKEKASDIKVAHAGSQVAQVKATNPLINTEITDSLVDQFLKGKDLLNPSQKEKIEKLKKEYANADKEGKEKIENESDLELFERYQIFGADHIKKSIPMILGLEIYDLFFSNPAQLLCLLRDPKIKFPKCEIKLRIKYFESRLDPSHDFAYAACLRELQKNETFFSIDFWSFKDACIQDNLPYTSSIFLQKENHHLKEINDLIFRWDGSTCLAELYKKKPTEFDVLLKKSIEAPAPKCIAMLLSQRKLDKNQFESYAKTAKESGSLETLLALCENDFSKAADFAFSEIIPFLKDIKKHENSIKDLLKKSIPIFLRFTPIAIVDKFVEEFAKKNQAAAPFLLSGYKKEKDNFLRISPFIARYTKLTALTDLHKVYGRKLTPKHTVEGDLTYGKFCRTHVESLEKDLGAGKFKAPKTKEFQSLPTSATVPLPLLRGWVVPISHTSSAAFA